MITPLEKGRLYFFNDVPLRYLEREWPEDHPPLFLFLDEETGEVYRFLLAQLDELELDGSLHPGLK